MKLLLSGDMHIGRTSTRLPAEVPAGSARAAEAWLRLVDLAIQLKVQAVCLSGDLVDADNRFWEALGPLEKGIRTLANADIVTLAVAGNHDHDVLPRLAQQLSDQHFVLLGQQGAWQRYTLTHGDQRLHIDGWSFPSRSVTTSPLESYDLPTDHTAATLGIVHGDLDSPASPYAPLDLARLTQLPPQGWLLGHIHHPRLRKNDAGNGWVLYPGSLQALDPGERGMHGPWLLTMQDGQLPPPQSLPLSSICYDLVDIDLSGVQTQQQLDSLLIDAVRQRASQLVTIGQNTLEAVSLRLCLRGTTPLAHQVRALADRLLADLHLTVGQTAVGVDAVQVDTLPAIVLEEHADSHTAVGALARLLLDLQRPQLSPQTRNLLRQTRLAIAQADQQHHMARLPGESPTDQQVKDQLIRETQALLTELLSQTT